jgi:RNA polymerase sigma factor (TIGR02999 family)
MGDLTLLLAQAGRGDTAAMDRVFALLYDDLSAMARSRLARGERVTLADTGALVHGAWLRLQQAGRVGFKDRGHFLAHASRVMRSVMVDLARRSLAQQRGGDVAHVPLDTELGETLAAEEQEVIDVERALVELAALDARLAQVVEMRYFGGLGDAEIGAALGVTDRTVRRDWDKARAFLALALK